ncbi:MAG: Gfo/Idh/MocA family oxidoreductase [Candidatus Hydrogenedentales bacterium]|jgi:predicted dehydrogenase
MDINRRQFMTTMAAASVAASVSAHAQDSATKKLKACIIGDTKNGGYGHDMHLVFTLRDNVEVVGLADPDEAGRTKCGAEAKAARLYADYREMLEKEKPDLVVVGPRQTPKHKEYLLACAEHGCHGILEKPLCVDLAEADEILAAMDAKNLKWGIGFNFRASALMQHVRKLVVEDRILGSILELRARGKEDNRAGGEDLVVLGCHIFDMMKYLMDKPSWCSADITFNGKPATKADVTEATEPLGPIVGNRISATFGFAQGVPGSFTSMKNRDGGGRWGLDLYGSQAVMTIRMNVDAQIYILRDPTWAPGGQDVKWEPLPDAPAPPEGEQKLTRYLPIINDVIACIGTDKTPMCSIQDGRDALEMTQAVFESYIQGGNRVAIPLKERTHPLKRWA